MSECGCCCKDCCKCEKETNVGVYQCQKGHWHAAECPSPKPKEEKKWATIAFEAWGKAHGSDPIYVGFDAEAKAIIEAVVVELIKHRYSSCDVIIEALRRRL